MRRRGAEAGRSFLAVTNPICCFATSSLSSCARTLVTSPLPHSLLPLALPLLSQIRSLHRALRHRLQEKLARNLERGEQVTTAVGVGLLVAASAFLVAKVVLGRGSKR